MVLSPALNIRSARGPLYDADALAFCRASGATERKAISDFVRGVKDLGLWGSMVCWPLRSSQNSGGADPTNTTVFSLGGLGTFNGTRVNGPTWGASGITFTNASSQYIGLGPSQILGGDSDYTIMGVAQLTNVAAINLCVLSLGNGRVVVGVVSNGSTQIRNVAWSNAGVSNTQVAAGPTTSMFAGLVSGDATNSKYYINSGAPYNTTAGDFRLNPAATTLPQIGANYITSISSNGHWNGVIAASVLWNVKLSDAQVASVLSLYKQTLGTGLGLP